MKSYDNDIVLMANAINTHVLKFFDGIKMYFQRVAQPSSMISTIFRLHVLVCISNVLCPYYYTVILQFKSQFSGPGVIGHANPTKQE